MMRVVVVFILVLIFNSCGYKPTAIYTKNVLGETIYAEVETSLQDPENSVLIKDAINEAILNQFHSKIRSKKDASSQLYIKLSSISFRPIEYDKNGYVTAYKILVSLHSTYIDKNRKKDSFITTGDYDFTIQTLSVISDEKRFDAIKKASQKAIDALISKISIKGIR